LCCSCYSVVLLLIKLLLLLNVLFYILFVCKCVLYYCHRVTTQLQLTNLSYHISHPKQHFYITLKYVGTSLDTGIHHTFGCSLLRPPQEIKWRQLQGHLKFYSSQNNFMVSLGVLYQARGKNQQTEHS